MKRILGALDKVQYTCFLSSPRDYKHSTVYKTLAAEVWDMNSRHGVSHEEREVSWESSSSMSRLCWQWTSWSWHTCMAEELGVPTSSHTRCCSSSRRTLLSSATIWVCQQITTAAWVPRPPSPLYCPQRASSTDTSPSEYSGQWSRVIAHLCQLLLLCYLVLFTKRLHQVHNALWIPKILPVTLWWFLAWARGVKQKVVGESKRKES